MSLLLLSLGKSNSHMGALRAFTLDTRVEATSALSVEAVAQIVAFARRLYDNVAFFIVSHDHFVCFCQLCCR